MCGYRIHRGPFGSQDQRNQMTGGHDRVQRLPSKSGVLENNRYELCASNRWTASPGEDDCAGLADHVD